MRISDWSSDVCSSDLATAPAYHGEMRSYAARCLHPVLAGGYVHPPRCRRSTFPPDCAPIFHASAAGRSPPLRRSSRRSPELFSLPPILRAPPHPTPLRHAHGFRTPTPPPQTPP